MGLTRGLQEPRMLAEWEVGGCSSILGFMGIFCSDLALDLDSSEEGLCCRLWWDELNGRRDGCCLNTFMHMVSFFTPCGLSD